MRTDGGGGGARQGHSHLVCSVAVLPDGKRAVSGSLDKTVKVWDLESGRCLATFKVRQPTAPHQGRFNSLGYTCGIWSCSPLPHFSSCSRRGSQKENRP
jgi:WD40 repeat protein